MRRLLYPGGSATLSEARERQQTDLRYSKQQKMVFHDFCRMTTRPVGQVNRFTDTSAILDLAGPGDNSIMIIFNVRTS